MAKYKTKGSVVKAGAANPPTVTVGQLGDSTFELGDRLPSVDVTTQDNSTGTEDKMDVGFKSPCKLSGEILYDPADTQHESLRAAQDAGTLLWFKLILSNTTTSFIFQGKVLKASLPIPVRGKQAMQIEIEGMGAYTFAA